MLKTDDIRVTVIFLSKIINQYDKFHNMLYSNNYTVKDCVMNLYYEFIADTSIDRNDADIKYHFEELKYFKDYLNYQGHYSNDPVLDNKLIVRHHNKVMSELKIKLDF